MANENAVAIKLPPFRIAQPRVKFQQAEGQIALQIITADTSMTLQISNDTADF